MQLINKVKDAAARPAGRYAVSPVLVVLAACVMAAGCAETQLAGAVVKKVSRDEIPSGDGGVWKVGRPYQIADQWYYPVEDDRYDSTGIASWYGPQFHKRQTANGEIFDMHKISAAHPTLPMPVMVRVTNLENGRALIVRVNDRGPFAGGREIDMSMRAAELLGFKEQGLAKVRVQYLGKADDWEDDTMLRTVQMPVPEDAPITLAQAEPASAVHLRSDAAPPPMAAAAGAAFFVQAGSFRDPGNANALADDLSDLGPVEIAPTFVSGTQWYRVRVGPVYTAADANGLRQSVMSRGQVGAHILSH